MTSSPGIHHVTAIASDAQRNVDFYAGLLGLRLVKRTVNFDDPQTYHLYYGDDLGHPGSLMTFFPWPGARRGAHGSGQVSVTSFAVPPSALGFWIERFVRHGIKYDGPTKRDAPGGGKEQALALADSDGLMLEIVAHPGAAQRPAWGGAPGIPIEHAIRGFHSVTLWVEQGDATEKILTDSLGFRFAGEEETTRTFVAGDGGTGTIVKVRSIGGFGRAKPGAGTVHHVAWRAIDDAAQLALREQVIVAGQHPTPVIDRDYFHSVYFREPGGVLFEIATDPPGFTIDEPAESLGEHLKLPQQHEPLRTRIEAVLPPLHLPNEALSNTMFSPDPIEIVRDDLHGFVHRYHPPTAVDEQIRRTTLLLLHGTGGDEDALIALGRMLVPGAGLLSPRGKVLERGAARFFRRLEEGVFDLDDLALRTDELGAFVTDATGAYGLDAQHIIAIGFSNGANVAVSLLFRHAGLLRGAVLFSPMLPYEPANVPRLDGTSVFIGAGTEDPIGPMAQVKRLQELLKIAGADVTLYTEAAGHTVTKGEIDAAQSWLRGR